MPLRKVGGRSTQGPHFKVATIFGKGTHTLQLYIHHVYNVHIYIYNIQVTMDDYG